MAKGITKEFLLGEIERVNASTPVDWFKFELTSEFNNPSKYVLVQRRNTMYNPIGDGDLNDIYNVLKGIINGLEMSGVQLKQSSVSKAVNTDSVGVVDYINSRIASKSPFVIVAEKHIINPNMCSTHWELSVMPVEVVKNKSIVNLVFSSKLAIKNVHEFIVDSDDVPNLVVEITDCKTMQGVCANILRSVNDYFYDNAPFGAVNEVYLNKLLWLTRENLNKLGLPLVGLTTRSVTHKLKD